MQNVIPQPSLCSESPTSCSEQLFRLPGNQVSVFPSVSKLPELICCILILVYTQTLVDKVYEILQA